MLLTNLFESALRDKEDLQAKRKAIQDIQMDPNTHKDPELKKELARRKADLEKEAKKKGLAESAENLNIGDDVIITGDVQYNGATGVIKDFGRDNRFVIVDLYNHGKHSFHSSDVSFNDYDDDEDDEDDNSDEGFFVAIGSEENGGFIGMITKDGGKWVEQKIAGTAPYKWGGTYMGYLSPNDVMSWIQKDYRDYDVEGPFDSEEEARDYASNQYGLDESDISGLLTANKLNRVFRVTANVDGKTKKFKVKAQSSRIAQHKVEAHQPGAKIINVEDITEVSESLADEFMKMAREKGMNPRLRGTPDEERARTDAMLKQRAARRAAAPKPAGPDAEERAKLEARLKELEARFDPDFEYSDDYSFWTKQNELSKQIRSIKQRLAQGVAEGLGLYGPFTVTINTGERPQSRTKTKKFRREDDAILWAQDWLEDAPQYVFATAQVTDPEGNVVWTTDEQGVAEGLRDPKDNPCWKGYHPVGTKKKDGRTVPNCVPTNEAPIAPTDNPNDPMIYGHEKANPMTLQGRIQQARNQLRDLARMADANDLATWEQITKLAKGGMFMGLEQNLEQIRHGIEQLAAKRKQGGVASRGIDKNIG